MTSFTPIGSERTTDQVVAQIRAAIASGQYSRGERLPTERELAANFQVSRWVIREAVKILNGMGLIESRQGSGLYVMNDPVPVISQALTISLVREEQMVQQLFDIRIALESLAAATAASQRTPGSIAKLREFTPSNALPDTSISLDTASREDARFHLAVAEAAGNPYLAVLIEAVSKLVSEAFPLTEDLRAGVLSARDTHIHIADAIAAGDPDLASRLMREHLERSGAYARQTVAKPTDLES